MILSASITFYFLSQVVTLFWSAYVSIAFDWSNIYLLDYPYWYVFILLLKALLLLLLTDIDTIDTNANNLIKTIGYKEGTKLL